MLPAVTASADPMETAKPLAHPEQDYAGVQIRKYESPPSTNVDAHAVMAQAKDQQTLGNDVSSFQSKVDWPTMSHGGGKFSYIKATEGVNYTNPYFDQQSGGSHQAGLWHGAYHFALPDVSNGIVQANFFVDHGGKWVRDGKTLPPALDMEYNPYGDVCYKLSATDMVNWVKAFSDQVHKRTGRYPMIYTSLSWWTKCTGNNASLGKTNPLWVARYNKDIGTLPNGWAKQTIWQFADKGPFPGDQNVLNGPITALTTLANG